MYIDIEKCGNICLIYLNRANTNSLDHQLLNELYETVCQISEDEDISVVIIGSRLSYVFSSGLDLKSFINDKRVIFEENVYNAVYTSFKIINTIVYSSKIYIAIISGPTIGSAASIAFSCDFRIATPNAWFWLPDTQYGGILADGGIELLIRLIGHSRTSMLVLTNERINADEAERWGLIYKIVPSDMIYARAFSMAKKICDLSYDSLRVQKKIINSNILSDFREEYVRSILSSEEVYKRVQHYINLKY